MSRENNLFNSILRIAIGILIFGALFLAGDAGAAPFAYITNFGSNNVSVIDTATNTVIATVDVGTNPWGVAVNPVGSKVYVANIGSNNVSVIDTATNTVAATVSVGLNPEVLAINPAGTKVYVANAASNNVSVIDTATNTVTATVNVGINPDGVAVNPAGTEVYVANLVSNNVSVIDTATNTVTATVNVSGPIGVAVNPAGSKVYVANYYINNVSVIDTATNTVIAAVNVGSGPFGVAVNPAGTEVYVANWLSNTTSVIDTTTNTVTATVNVGTNPEGVAVNPAGTKVYVANYGSNNVSVIDTEKNTVTATVNVGLNPSAFGQFIGPTSAPTPVSSCQVISLPGVYVLNTSLESSSTCISITSSDVILDGAGYSINGVDTSTGDYGVEVNNLPTNLTNITITNLNVANWGEGIRYENVLNGYILNNTANSNFNYGIHLISSSNNTLNDNTASSNGNGIESSYGIYLNDSSNNTLNNNTANSNNGYYDAYFRIFYGGYGIYLLESNNNNLSSNAANSNDGYGIHLISSSNNTLNDNTANSNYGYYDGYGIHLISSSNNTLNDNTANSNDGYGIYLSDSSNNTLNDNTANSNYKSSSDTSTTASAYGIYLISSNNNTLDGNTANSNNGSNTGYLGIGYGIYIESSSNNTFNGNIANSNSGNGVPSGYGYGIYVASSSDNTFSGNTANMNNGTNDGYGAGIALASALDNNFTNNTVNSNNFGMYLTIFFESGPSSDNTFLNNTAKTNTLWDFYSESDSINNTVTNLIMDYMTTISFTGKDVAIKPAISPADNPSINYQNISKYINATNTSFDSWLFLNVSYTDSDVIGVQENTLRMWEYSGSSWSQVSGTNNVDTSQKYVYANITSFSIFAPMGIEGIPPASVTNLKNISFDPTFILWTWTDPTDLDFAAVIIYINGILTANVSNGTQSYFASGLIPDTLYTISTRTVDINGNINQTWVNNTARTSIPGFPIVININTPENNSINTTGNITVMATLDRPGTAILNWNGINETMDEIMDGSGRNYSRNKTDLLSGTYIFKVYANDSSSSNVSETRIVGVDRRIESHLPIDQSGKIIGDFNVPAPSGNTTVTFYEGTNISFYNSTGILNCGGNILINSWANLDPDIAEKLESLKFAGENLSLEPECINITDAQIRTIPDIQIRFNYTPQQVSALGLNDASKLTVKYFNNTTKSWLDVNVSQRNTSANYIVVNTSHFTFFVLAVPALAAVTTGVSTTGGGGGGTGGQGAITREPPENVEKFETRTNNLASDSAVSYKYSPTAHGIIEIVVTGKRPQADMPIRVELLKGLSKLINQSAPETVHYYENIWSGTEDIKDVLIRFREENSWITSNNLNNVKMLKWDGRKWVELETRETGKDSTYTYFETRSNSLSQLAVIGEAAPTPPPTPSQTPEGLQTTTAPTTSVTPSTPLGTPIKLNYILIVFAIILGVVIMVLSAIGSVTRISTEQLIGKSPEEYGEKYHEHLLEQYKLYVKIADKVSERRQSVNNYFLTLDLILMTLFGVLSGFESITKQYMWQGQYLLPFAGFLVSIMWGTLMSSYRTLYSGKLKVIYAIESQLPAALYGSELKIIGEDKARRYLSLKNIEQLVPWIFAGFYLLLIVIVLWPR